MASEIRAGGVHPGPVREPATLQEKQEAKLPGERRPVGALRPEDAARLVQQAGLVRSRRKKGLDLGDSSHAPIPLPDDETAAETWSPERLEEAQRQLDLAAPWLAEAAGGGRPLGEAVASGAFPQSELGIAALQALAGGEAPEGIDLDEVAASLRGLLGLELPEGAPRGLALLATGVAVAGEAGAIAAGDVLDERALAAAVRKIAEKSNQAMAEAQKMTRGVSRELGVQRTFVVKR